MWSPLRLGVRLLAQSQAFFGTPKARGVRSGRFGTNPRARGDIALGDFIPPTNARGDAKGVVSADGFREWKQST